MTMADEIAVMNAGQVEQRGSAQELYERPRTAFVANFLGTANLIGGDVAGTGEIVTQAGERLRFRGEASGRVAAGVRPEKIRIGPPADGENALRGTVLVASYLGTALQYVVRTPGGSELTVLAQNDGDGRPSAGPGAEVELSWRPEHTFVVDAE